MSTPERPSIDTKSPVKPSDEPVSKTKFHEYEFGGPIGAWGMMLGLPVGVYALSWAASKPSLPDVLASLRPALSRMLEGQGAVASTGLLVFSAWMGFQAVLERLLPGKDVEGCPLPQEPTARLEYRINGHKAFWVTALAAALLHLKNPSGQGLSRIYDMYPQLRHGSIAFAALLSVYLYVSSFFKTAKGKKKLIADGGQSPSKVYNFFMGRELNPRLGSFDLKVFCELRPGLIGWSLINAGMAAKQFQRTGGVSLPMLLVNAFQGLYVWDALYFEQSILSTMDITTEGFGYMLAFGDLVWVPFVYSLQSRFLAEHDPGMSKAACLAVAALNALGYYIFRGSNLEKDQFRRDPAAFPNKKTLKTKRGTNLIVDGWWGMARKINYTGDIVMATAWSLYCGVKNPLTLFYPAYLAGLLYHRALRDDAFCQEKYGSDWDEYKKQVPYLLIPGLL